MRLIDADAFEVVTTKLPNGMDAESYMAGVEFVLNKIDDAPTVDAVEVIRCGQCKHADPLNKDHIIWCYVWEDTMRENEFCSKAERRQDGKC